MTYRDDVALAERANQAYYDGAEPVMTDAAYDALLDRIRAFEREHPEQRIAHHLFDRVAGGDSEGGDVRHAWPMLSLDKVRNLAEVRAFAGRILAEGSPLELEPKLDGLAIAADYRDGALVQVSTRGDGTTGEDVTRRARALRITGLPDRIPDHRPIEMRGELLMSHDDFTRSNAARQAAGHPPFANPRNATAGSLRAESLDYPVHATFILYDRDDVVTEATGVTGAPMPPAAAGIDPAAWGFLPAASLLADPDEAGRDLSRITDPDVLIAGIEAFGRRRAAGEFPYPTDGVVIKAVDRALRARLGHTARAPRWAMAYKYEAQKATTVLRDIEMAVGRTGNISFTGVFDPVTVDGSTITRATLHNYAFIHDRDIRIGDTVEVFKANDVIPRIDHAFPELRDGTEQPYDPPRVSPLSGTPLDTSEVIWRSTDPNDSLGSWISYAVARDCFDIEGIGGEIAAALVEQGLVGDIADLFTLSVKQLATLPLGENRQLGEKNARKIAAQIDRARHQPLGRVIAALGIRRTGRTMARRLAAHFHTMAALRAADEEALAEVDGVGPERARLVRQGLDARAEVIDKLAAAAVDMGEEPAEATAEPGPLDGMTVVVTGAMTGPLASRTRNEMNELIEAAGGRSAGSVSKRTSLLVCGEEGSSKWRKAKELGVRIVTPGEFAKMLGLV